MENFLIFCLFLIGFLTGRSGRHESNRDKSGYDELPDPMLPENKKKGKY